MVKGVQVEVEGMQFGVNKRWKKRLRGGGGG